MQLCIASAHRHSARARFCTGAIVIVISMASGAAVLVCMLVVVVVVMVLHEDDAWLMVVKAVMGWPG